MEELLGVIDMFIISTVVRVSLIQVLVYGAACNNRNLCLMVREAGKPKMKTPADSGSGSGTAVFSRCPHMAEGVSLLSVAYLMRALTPFWWAPHS